MSKKSHYMFINNFLNQGAKELAKNDNFKKNWTFEMIKNYSLFFSEFMDKNFDKIEKLSKTMSKKDKSIFSKQLNFFNGIFKLISFENDEVVINTDFLNKHFKLMKSKTEINDWNNELKKINHDLSSIKWNDEVIDLLKLYNFSNSILMFLTDENFRIKIATTVLEDDSKKEEVEDFKYEFLNKQNESWKNKARFI